ncbi:MAG: histidine phosphatase family protein [Pseudolabrys sp.]|nr:histidine phosphatase family protein [Pseudolabrys sp.]
MLTSGASIAAADPRAWEALRGDGHVALIRHASAPGVGDPAGYRLDDCMTQRNLNDAGRGAARALGDRFRAERVRVGKVVASQWCRSRQTAELMNIGPVEDAPAFNNVFVLRDQRDRITAEGRAAIAAWGGPGTLVVGTHGDNIYELLGFNPREAEVVVVKPDAADPRKMRLIGRIPPP